MEGAKGQSAFSVGEVVCLTTYLGVNDTIHFKLRSKITLVHKRKRRLLAIAKKRHLITVSFFIIKMQENCLSASCDNFYFLKVRAHKTDRTGMEPFS